MPEEATDYGPELVSQFRSMLRVEEQWSETIDRGFHWWGHRLRQTIWADRPERLFRRDWSTCLRAETVVVDGYDDEEALGALASLNQRAVGHAYYLEPETRTVRAHTSLAWDGSNTYRLPLVAVAVAYQLILAEQVADGLAARVGGAPAASAHPTAGTRAEGSPILAHLAIDRIHVDAALPARVADFDLNALAEVLRRGYVEREEPEVLAVERLAGGRGVSASFPMLFTALGGLIEEPKLGGGRPAVAIFGHDTHPEVGYGLLIELTSPIVLDAKAGARLADRLNRDDATGGRGVDLLGAWWSRDGQVGFTSFLPGGAVRQIMPGLHEARHRVTMLHGLFDPSEQRMRLARLGDACRALAVTGDGPPAAEAARAETTDIDELTRARRAATAQRLATAVADRGPFLAEEALYDLPVAAPLARFGLFDQANPALVTLDLLGVEETGELVLVHTLRHPSHPQTWVHAVLEAGTTPGSEATGEALRRVLVERAGQEGGPLSSVLPDFVDLGYGGPDVEPHLRGSFLALAERLAAERGADLAARADLLEHYRYDPWARLNQVDIDPPPPPERPAGLTPAERWWLAVTDEVNVFAHQYHLPDVWEAAARGAEEPGTSDG